jgi:RpiR family transcriptional regulator, carbohydrate utilization regulator
MSNRTESFQAPSELAELGVLTRTRSIQMDLSPAEGKVARILLENPHRAAGASAERLAVLAGTSTASVIRLCRTLGYGGLKELRLALALELPGSSPHTLVSETAGRPASTLEKVLEADIQALRETLQLLSFGTLERAVQALGKASQIEVFAYGLSAPIALDATYRFQRLGLNASYLLEAHMQAVRAGAMKRGQVGLVISHSGRSPQAVSVLRAARAGGAKVIGLTSAPRSPVALEADIALILATSEAAVQRQAGVPEEATSSRIAHLAVVDTLCVSLAQLAPGRARKALRRAREIEAGMLVPPEGDQRTTGNE